MTTCTKSRILLVKKCQQAINTGLKPYRVENSKDHDDTFLNFSEKTRLNFNSQYKIWVVIAISTILLSFIPH